MNIILIFIILGLAILIAGLIFLIYKINTPAKGKKNQSDDPYDEQILTVIKSIFDDDFREELKNRGRLHFEKVINDNAMFLQQDLAITTSQIHDYLKDEITKKLQEEFKKYQDTIEYAKKLAVESITKTQTVIEDQRQALSKQIESQFEDEKKMLVNNFQQNMADIINHYLLKAVGGHINLNDQLEFILADLEANKKIIAEDINEGA
jgi:hypothetical protein